MRLDLSEYPAKFPVNYEVSILVTGHRHYVQPCQYQVYIFSSFSFETLSLNLGIFHTWMTIISLGFLELFAVSKCLHELGFGSMGSREPSSYLQSSQCRPLILKILASLVSLASQLHFPSSRDLPGSVWVHSLRLYQEIF